MVRLFDKLKGALSPVTKRQATQQPTPPTSASPEPDSTPVDSPDQPITPPIATPPGSPSEVSEAPAQPVTLVTHTSPEPAPDATDATSATEAQSQPETPQKRSYTRARIIKRAPRIVISPTTREVKRPQPAVQESQMDDVDDPETKASHPVHVITRKPIRQKRQRNIAVVRPKFHIAKKPAD